MAYIGQDKKNKIHANLKPILKKYGVRGSLRIRNHMSLCLTVSGGELNPFEDWGSTFPLHNEGHIDVNTYHYRNHFTGRTREFLIEALSAMNEGNHDRSDAMTDYFDVGWYVYVTFGKWDKPYALT